MAGMIIRKTGVVLLTIIKGLLYTVEIILKMLLGSMKIFLLVITLIASIVLSLVGIASRN